MTSEIDKMNLTPFPEAFTVRDAMLMTMVYERR